MARASQIVKLNTPSKFSTRNKSRCKVCGRSRGYYRDFALCRICVRLFGLRGEIPGLTKASW
jgi:small subunit ribosomal protein S14